MAAIRPSEGKHMNQSLNNLEINVYQLVQKFETLVSENRRLNEEIDRLKLEQEQQKRQHDAAIDELSEALLVQVGKLKEDLQSKIDNLTAEKENYRNALAQSADQIRSLITRLPQEHNNKRMPREYRTSQSRHHECQLHHQHTE